MVEGVETICAKCVLRRAERKEIITEIVETEGKYGRDLKIIVEEFYRPMLVAGLLSSDQLASIFLNVEQLIQVGNTKKTFNIENCKKLSQVNTSFCQRLKEAVDLSSTTGDEELTGVNVGRIFIQAMPMLQVKSCSCSKQAPKCLKIDLSHIVLMLICLLTTACRRLRRTAPSRRPPRCCSPPWRGRRSSSGSSSR